MQHSVWQRMKLAALQFVMQIFQMPKERFFFQHLNQEHYHFSANIFPACHEPIITDCSHDVNTFIENTKNTFSQRENIKTNGTSFSLAEHYIFLDYSK